MALDQGALSQLIVTELASAGFTTTGEYAYAQNLADAIAAAVVTHVTDKAEVPVTAGSSAGTYKVE